MVGQLASVVANAARDRVVQTGSAAVLVPATSTTLHALGLSGDLNASIVAGGFFEQSLWLTLGMAALFGALGGVVAELMSLHGRIELPHRVKRGRYVRRSRLADPHYEIDLGLFSRMLLGAAAALALISIYTPGNAIALLVNSLIAGSAGTFVFRVVQGRMLGKGQAATTSEPERKTKLSVVGGKQASASR
jgi:hypothetical protein